MVEGPDLMDEVDLRGIIVNREISNRRKRFLKALFLDYKCVKKK